MKGISSHTIKLDSGITLSDAQKIKELTGGLKEGDRLKIDHGITTSKLSDGKFEENVTATFIRTNNNNLQKLIQNFQKLKNNFLVNKSIFAKPELTSSIFDSSISVKKLNRIADQKIEEFKQNERDSTKHKVAEKLQAMTLTKSVTDGIDIEKNIRRFLIQNKDHLTLGVPENKIESTAAIFKTIVTKILYKNKDIKTLLPEDRALLTKYFETLPNELKTKLEKLDPTINENKISMLASEDNSLSNHINNQKIIDTAAENTEIQNGLNEQKISDEDHKNFESDDAMEISGAIAQLKGRLREMGVW
jgi:hypothetical protein